jgi:hypothetical protein
MLTEVSTPAQGAVFFWALRVDKQSYGECEFEFGQQDVE